MVDVSPVIVLTIYLVYRYLFWMKSNTLVQAIIILQYMLAQDRSGLGLEIWEIRVFGYIW